MKSLLVDILYVAGEATISRESHLAEVALERLFSRMHPHVNFQVVGPGKLLATTLPCALIRLLPRMDPHVPRQGRAIREDLLADRTDTRLPNLQGLRKVCI